MGKKRSPVEKLMQYMDACAHARAQAEWTNGYRTGRMAQVQSVGDDAEDDRLYRREVRQSEYCGVVEERFRRYAAHVLRVAARDAETGDTQGRSMEEGKNG